MKKLLLLFLVFFAAKFAYSTPVWESQNYTQRLSSYNSIYFIDAKTGWVVGEKGVILKTTDGGKLWSPQTNSDTSNLYGVYFSDSLNGFAVGAQRRVLKTTDGGKNWLVFVGPGVSASANLTDINFIDKDNGWIRVEDYIPATEPNSYYTRCLYYKTDNGGTSWAVKTYDTLEFQIGNETKQYLLWAKNFYFKTPAIGFAVGDLGISATTNGGNNWSVLFLGLEKFSNIAFCDNMKTGWVVGDTGEIYKITIDSLFHLTPQNSQILTPLKKINIVNEDTVFILSKNNEILRTTDGGTNWEMVFNSANNTFCSDIFFLNKNLAFGAGSSATVLKSEDVGKTWNLATNTFTNANLGESVFIDANTGWIAAQNGTVLKTTNAGAEWVSKTVSGSDSYYGMYMNNANTGWLVGGTENQDYIPIGLVYRTTNGGTDWVKVYEKEEMVFNDIWSINETTAFAVGESGYMAKTVNSGANWTPVTVPVTTTFSSIYFVDNTYGWAVCSGGKMIRTTNGGADWTAMTSGVTSDLKSIYFMDRQNGWAVGDKGVLLTTATGGSSWTKSTFSGGKMLNSVRFYDKNTGFIGGADGLLIYTSNAGANWYNQPITTLSVNSINMVSANLGWVVGNEGLIYKYTDAVAEKLLAPVLTSPANAATNVSLTAQLAWNAVSGASNYSVQVSENANFSSFVINQSSVSATNLALSGLANAKTYYWRVRAKSATDSSDLSSVWSFTTASPDGVIDTELNALLTMSPNPATDYINAKFNFENAGNCKISIYNTLGEVILSVKDAQVNAGELNEKIDVSNIPSGAYIFTIDMNGRKSSKNITILR